MEEQHDPREEKQQNDATARFSSAKNKKEIKAMEESIREWLDEHKFSYDEIWIKSAKPPAQAYIDDHGVYCCPAKEGIGAFNTALVSTKYLLKLNDYGLKVHRLFSERLKVVTIKTSKQ